MKRPASSLRAFGWLLLLAVVMVGQSGCVIRTLAFGLKTDPGRITPMKVEKNLMVPMRDGVMLATDVYRPAQAGPFPAIVTRLPYGSDNVLFETLAKLFARNGYAFVVQDTRGDRDSEGTWFPFVWEYDDGHDTIDWISEQPWCNGKIGTWGGSYFGYTQLIEAPDNDKIACMNPLMTSGNIIDLIFRDGAGNFLGIQGWLTSQKNDQAKKHGEGPSYRLDLSEGYYNEPIRPARPIDFEAVKQDPEALAAGPGAWLAHPGDIEHLPPLNYENYYDRVTAPMLSIAGWYDPFLGPQLADFVRFNQVPALKGKVRLVVGPWTHGGFITHFEKNKLDGFQTFGENFMDWFDYWLKDEQNGAADQAPIKLFVIGENVWRDENEWPLARTVSTDYYLRGGGRANAITGDGRLSTEPPGAEPPDQYDYDPTAPVPTRGGAFLAAGGFKPGAQDQGDVPRRDDVLVYVTDPLAEDLEVTGPITLVLNVASSARDTDFVAKLLDLDPRGKETLLTIGVIRARYRDGYQDPQPLVPGQVYELKLDLWATSNLFKRGHRVMLLVTSSDFPQFDRNINAGGEGGNYNFVTASQTVFHDADRPSRLILPVIPR